MAQFNLEDYEPVEDRIQKFYQDHQDGRIITEVIFQDVMWVTFKAAIHKNADSPVWATGHAQEFRDTELKKNKWGKEYETVNYSSHLENCETSAIGRALANAGYVGSKRPSREEMTKVKLMNETARRDVQPEPTQEPKVEVHPPTDDQLKTIKGLAMQAGYTKEEREKKIAAVTTYQIAEQSITKLREKVAQKRQSSEPVVVPE